MKSKRIITSIILAEDVWERAKIKAMEERVSLAEIIRQGLILRLEKNEL